MQRLIKQPPTGRTHRLKGPYAAMGQTRASAAGGSVPSLLRRSLKSMPQGDFGSVEFAIPDQLHKHGVPYLILTQNRPGVHFTDHPLITDTYHHISRHDAALKRRAVLIHTGDQQAPFIGQRSEEHTSELQ